MMRRRAWLVRGVTVLFGLSVVLNTSACVKEVPLVSDQKATSIETLDELRAWTGVQGDIAITATGVAEGWYEGGNGVPEVYWVSEGEDRDRILDSLFPTSCGSSGAGQLYLRLKNGDERSDSFAVADRVWAFWESSGWTVRYVIEPSAEERYFRADRADGAMLTFRASENWLGIGIQTNCSSHNTVTNWPLYLDSSDPFQEELDRRELAQ